MSKRNEKNRRNENGTAKLALITAIVSLIRVLISLIEKLIELLGK